MISKYRFSLIKPIVALALCFAALLALILYFMTTETNRVARDSEERSVQSAINQQIDGMRRTAYNNAVWDEAAKAVYRPVLDTPFFWLNWGSATSEGISYEIAALFDAKGKLRLAYQMGRVVDARVLNEFGTPLQTLLQQASRKDQAVGGLLRTKDGIYLVGSSEVRPVNRALDSLVPAQGSNRLAFFRKIDDDRLAELGEDLGLYELSFQSAEQQLALRDPAGSVVAYIGWLPPQPGLKAVWRMLPVLSLITILMLALAGHIFWRGMARLRWLAQEAMMDSLSGLPNRRQLRDELDETLAGKEAVALAILDLDGFKSVNDSYGHEVGDRLIKDASVLLTNIVRAQGSVTRLGGDEFAILISGKDAVQTLEILCRNILGRFIHPFRIDERTVAVGCSIGLATCTDQSILSSELMRRADTAMYSAKRSGKMRMCWYDAALDRHQAHSHSIAAELRQALERDEFSLVYQPMMVADGTSLIAVEALLRWHHPTRGLVPPADFIRIAEETGLIDRIGQFVLRRACSDGLKWPTLSITVNVSPTQLRNPELPAQISKVLEETAYPPERLELEITESFLIEDPELARRVIGAIRALGVGIVLDEYGRGFASVGFLSQFDFSKIKLDRTLVREASSNEATRTLLQASVAVGRALGMGIAASGVESSEDASLMRVAGCDQVQGWHFSEALPAGEISDLVFPKASFDAGKQMRLG